MTAKAGAVIISSRVLAAYFRPQLENADLTNAAFRSLLKSYCYASLQLSTTLTLRYAVLTYRCKALMHTITHKVVHALMYALLHRCR